MSDLRKLAEQMKSDWDRRVDHDYRFWMSDGYKDDASMWEAGERDMSILLKDAGDTSHKTMLELGCGVGRLLRAGLKRFKHVIGIDVSESAIKKAHEFLNFETNLELYTGNGIDLTPVPDHSVDTLISFAALTSIPTSVIANYMREFHRVLKPGGEVRLQAYLGKEQKVAEQDTLYLRCYAEENFRRAAVAAGFEVCSIQELLLPIQVSFKEVGITAVIILLRKSANPPATREIIAHCLLPAGGEDRPQKWNGSELEQFMVTKYAKELIAAGKRKEAERALQHILDLNGDTRFTVAQLFHELEKEDSAPKAAALPAQTDYFAANFALLQQRFPEIAAEVRDIQSNLGSAEVTVGSSADGAVLNYNGQCLDHPSKPIDAAKAWLERCRRERKFDAATQIAVYGMGAGYHVEQMLDACDKPVVLIEPLAAVFVWAMRVRDLSGMLSRISNISIGTSSLPKFFEPGGELFVRPQSQAFSDDYCAAVRSAFFSTRGFTSLHPKVGVLGPFQGGTLPMVAYVDNALARKNQRHRPLDVSGFTPGYHLLDQFVNEKQRLNVMQGNYVEMVSQLLIESIEEHPVDVLVCLAQAPISGRALTEIRKKGVVTALWFVEDYLRFGYWREMARFYDFVFTIQQGECLNAIKQAGAGEVHYVPCACDPEVHRPVTLSTEEKRYWGSPVSFVGSGYYNRQQSFASFAKLPFKIWGTEWPGCRPFDAMVQEGGRRISPEEYVKIFSASEININLHSSGERDGVDPFGDFVNPRTFELAACGGFQLVDKRLHLPELFEQGKEVVVFNSIRELREQIEHYLKHPEERIPIVKNARERVLRDHTYEARVITMLQKIYGNKFEHLRQREQSSDWGKMLARSVKHSELHERCEKAFERGEAAKLDGLVYDIVTGEGKLTETEQKLLFLHHIRKQIINMKREEGEG